MLHTITEPDLQVSEYYRGRWSYLGIVVDLVKEHCVNLQPANVLELGAYLLPVVIGSHTMDVLPEATPTYLHNAKQIPWPMTDHQYSLVIACQMLEHLGPPDCGVQERIFTEIRRVNTGPVIISVPYGWSKTQGWHGCITNDTVARWAGKRPSGVRVDGARYPRAVFWWAEL